MDALLWTLRAVEVALCFVILALWALTWAARRRHRLTLGELAAVEARHALAHDELRRARRRADLSAIGLFCALRLNGAPAPEAERRRGTEHPS